MIVTHFQASVFTKSGSLLDQHLQGEKKEVQKLITTSLRIQYGWKNKDYLSTIITNHFQDNMDTSEFCKGFKIYTIDKDFMDSYDAIDAETVEVYVEIYDPDVLFAIYTLRKENGKFLIDNIEYDKQFIEIM